MRADTPIAIHLSRYTHRKVHFSIGPTLDRLPLICD